jgi:hypothetical protein
MECEGQKIYRPYVSGSWRLEGGLNWWVDECVVEPRVVTPGGQQMAWVGPTVLAAVVDGWCASRAECDREVVRILRAKAQEILDQAAKLEQAAEDKAADH